jgi:hypothetical protein
MCFFTFLDALDTALFPKLGLTKISIFTLQ